MPRDDCHDYPCPGCLECSAGYTNDLAEQVRDLGLRTNDIERTFVPLLSALAAALLTLLSGMDAGSQRLPNRGVVP